MNFDNALQKIRELLIWRTDLTGGIQRWEKILEIASGSGISDEEMEWLIQYVQKHMNQDQNWIREQAYVMLVDPTDDTLYYGLQEFARSIHTLFREGHLGENTREEVQGNNAIQQTIDEGEELDEDAWEQQLETVEVPLDPPEVQVIFNVETSEWYEREEAYEPIEEDEEEAWIELPLRGWHQVEVRQIASVGTFDDEDEWEEYGALVSLGTIRWPEDLA